MKQKMWLFILILVLAIAVPRMGFPEITYKGRALVFIHGYNSGSPPDVGARLIAKYIAKYLPGQPAVLVDASEEVAVGHLGGRGCAPAAPVVAPSAVGRVEERHRLADGQIVPTHARYRALDGELLDVDIKVTPGMARRGAHRQVVRVDR